MNIEDFQPRVDDWGTPVSVEVVSHDDAQEDLSEFTTVEGILRRRTAAGLVTITSARPMAPDPDDATRAIFRFEEGDFAVAGEYEVQLRIGHASGRWRTEEWRFTVRD